MNLGFPLKQFSNTHTHTHRGREGEEVKGKRGGNGEKRKIGTDKARRDKT